MAARYVRYAAAAAAIGGAAYGIYRYIADAECLADEEDLPEVEGNHSKLLRYQNCRWLGIETQEYKAEGTAEFKQILRTELIGKHGESCAFHVRYFEVGPGGYSTLEKHQHEHVVIPIRGRGVVTIGGTERALLYGDVVYVSPNEPHQLLCPAECHEPLGFLCIVNAVRDKPVPLRRLADGSFEEIMGAASACEFIPKHLRKPGDPGYKPPKP